MFIEIKGRWSNAKTKMPKPTTKQNCQQNFQVQNLQINNKRLKNKAKKLTREKTLQIKKNKKYEVHISTTMYSANGK